MEKVLYKEEFGKVFYPEGFEELIKGLTIEEQMNYFRTTSVSEYSVTDYLSRTLKGGYCHIDKDHDVKALIIKDGLIAGVMLVNDCGRIVPCLPEDSVCTYYADDNNGAGSKTRIDYTWLLCVPEGF